MSHDTWIHGLVRPLVVPLVESPVTPNHVTTLRLGFGLLAAAVCALGDERSRAIGAGLFVVALLLDRADGILARLSGKTSAFGHRYDLVSDAIGNATIFVGLGIGLGGWAVPLGIAAGASVVVILALVLAAERAGGERAAELPAFARFDADDAMIAVPVAVWLGWSAPLVWLAGLVTPVVAVFFALRHRRLARPRA
jgi:phosphatidylglycerophosphate synthase